MLLLGELISSGSFASRLSAEPADLAIVYAGEHKGSVQTCGCKTRPRGSLSRLEAYADAVARSVATVRVHAGHWIANPTMIEGLSAGEWDAINVTWHDLPDLPADTGLPLVSANIRGPGVRKWVVVERGGRKVGITGISAMGAVATSGYTFASAVDTVRELVGQADVVVLAQFHAAEETKALLRAVRGVDVVIDADVHREQLDPAEERGAVWVFSNYEGLRVGELRLGLDGGKVRKALDRQVDLDPEVPDDPLLAAIQEGEGR